MKKITLLLVTFLITGLTFSQVAINSDGATPNSKSILDITSTTKGMLIPRMTTSERTTLGNTLTVAEKGMLVYDTEQGAFYYFDGSSWVKLASYGNSDDDWTVSGDNMYSAVSGDVGIGKNTNFQGKLDVNGKIYADNSSGDALQVFIAGNPSISPLQYWSSENNGLEINGAQGHGVFVGAADKSGFYVHNAAENGVFIGTSATGVWVDDATTDGIHIENVGNATENNSSSENNGLEIAGAAGNGVFVGQADLNGFYAEQVVKDGINIKKAGNPTATLSSTSNNGIEIQGAEGNGIFVGRAYEDGIKVWSVGAPSNIAYSSSINGFEVNGAEGNGVYVGVADENGVKVSVAGEDGINVFKAGEPQNILASVSNNGIEIQGAEGSGVFVGRAYEDGLQVYKAGTATTFHSSTSNNGVEIQGAQGNGIFVGYADLNGVQVKEAIQDGIQVIKAGAPTTTQASTDNNGIEIQGAQGNGVYVGRADISGVYIESAIDGLEINSANTGVKVNNAINDGIVISKAGTTSSTALTSSNNNGIEVPLAQGYGLYVGRTDISGVYIQSAAGDGFYVESAIDGLEINSVNTGVKVNNASNDGIIISKAGTTSSTALPSNSHNGIEVQLAQDNGIYIGQADQDGIKITKAGSPSSTIVDAVNDGIEIAGAEGNGIFIGQADDDGVKIAQAGVFGVYIDDAGSDGVYVNSAGYRGVYASTVNSNQEWGIYTPDKIYGSNVTSKSSSTYGKNTGNQSLQAGDVVCIAGGMEENIDGVEGLFAINLEKAVENNKQAVFGVVEYKVNIKNNEKKNKTLDNQINTTEDKSFAYTDGNIYSGDYFSVIILGPAEVNVDNKANINVGDNVCIGNNGVSSQRVTEVNGISIAENVGILGKSMGTSSGGKMLVYVNCK